jgi:hypothetical protein
VNKVSVRAVEVALPPSISSSDKLTQQNRDSALHIHIVIHIVRSSYKPPDLEATRSLLSSARVRMEAGHGTMERSTLLQDETIAICEIVAYFAQEYPRETATEIGEALTQVPLPVILSALRSAVTKLAGPP